MDTNTPTTEKTIPARTPFYRRKSSRKAYCLAAGFLLAGLLAWVASLRGRCGCGYRLGLPALDGFCKSDGFYYVATTWALVALVPWLVVRFLRANALGWQKLSWFSLLSFLAMVGGLNLHSMLNNAWRLNLINYRGTSEWIFLSYVLFFGVTASFVLLCYNEFGNAFFRGDGKGTKIVPKRTLTAAAIILPSIFMVLTLNLQTCPDPYEDYQTAEAEPELTPPDSLRADDFAFDVFRDIVAGRQGNIVFSPAGLESQMHLLRQGAGGATRDAIDSLPMGRRGVPSTMRICTAEALFADKTLRLKPEVAPEIVRVPFSRRPRIAVDFINRWCKDQTKGCIDSLVSYRDVHADTRLIVANTVYLDEKWLRPFKRHDTHPAIFHLAGGMETETPMMKQTSGFLYAEGEDWQAVALFYRAKGRTGEPGCFIGILPKGDAREFARTLTAQKYNEIRLTLARTELTNLELRLPKMEVSTESFQLDIPLRKQGLGVLFDRNAADFSGFTDEQVYLGGVLQRCYVKVDERGTVAASAAAAIERSFSLSEKSLIFDKPFIWAIGDLTSDAPPYFLGLFEKP